MEEDDEEAEEAEEDDERGCSQVRIAQEALLNSERMRVRDKGPGCGRGLVIGWRAWPASGRAERAGSEGRGAERAAAAPGERSAIGISSSQRRK